MCLWLTVCVCDLRQLQMEGGQFISLWRWEKGVGPCTRLARQADSSVSDITFSHLTYLKVAVTSLLSLSLCRFFLCPLPPSLIQLLSLGLFSSQFFLSPLSDPFFFLYSFFSPASCGGKHTGIGIKQERATEREERERAKMQTHLPLPITQFLQIKAIPMNIYVLEGSAGPDDMTKREGKLPPCGRKKASETQKRRDLVLILMFS